MICIVVADWDFDRFSEAVKIGIRGEMGRIKQQTSLRARFNMPKMGEIDTPATIVDRHGKIMVWYLPKVFLPGRIVSFP